ncbi:MAG: tRNA 4-thiouridine(8) synthase ThiI [Methanoregulaceae archaeon]|nr:tRNA 4-thiouridine(8) synthase ThiI [Methanoregulaceae archaeon]
MTEVVLLRYGELFLKSDPVQRHFTSILVRNCAKALDSMGIAHRFEIHRGRILVHGEDPQGIAGAIGRVFGVVDASVARLTSPDLEEMTMAAVDLAKQSLREGMTFAVRARRQGVTGITSQEIGTLVGSAIQREMPFARVSLSEPDYEIHVEFRDFGGLVYDSRVNGPGGLPWGTQGRALSLLSGGIDSPVASWLMMKRGCEIVYVHFDGGKWAGSDVRSNVLENLRRLSLWTAGFPARLIEVRAEELYDSMEGRVEPRYRCILCKRFMIRAGCAIACREGVPALVTGENLGQVASQTLENLAVISGAATLPILRPLITYDKNEVITLARVIGTFEPRPGDVSCRAVPRMPATKAECDAVSRGERAIGIESLVREASSRTSEITALDGKLQGPG